MRGISLAFVAVFLVLAVGTANAQLIVEDFDAQTTGSPPAWLWWDNGRAGTIMVDETIYRGTSGKSVEIVRTDFDTSGFGFGGFSFGRNLRPLDGPAELTFYFRVASTSDEVVTAVGGNNAYGQVAWWVGVGGAVGNAIGTYSEIDGWNHVLEVAVDTWYGVTLEIDPATFTYDITVWEDGNPGNTSTESDIPFRDGSAVDVIDQFQFGNFSDEATGPSASAFIDDVEFIGARVSKDDFESGNTGSWTWSTRPRTAVTTCYQTVTTDAYLANDLNCDTGPLESVGVELGASFITLDLNGHTISGHRLGIGVRAMNLEGVTIKNGWIKDFGVGVDIVSTVGALVKDVKSSNLVEDDPDQFLPGMRITLSEEILVRDSFVEFLPVVHKEAFVLATSEVTMDNVEVAHGSVGVNISGDSGTGNVGSMATVINSRFIDINSVAGILIQWGRTSWIAGNEFTLIERGVFADIHGPDGITDISIEDNSIKNGFIGVHFMGGADSTISNNLIRMNHKGIFMDSQMGCPPDTYQPGCDYATNNVISGNDVTGSYRDLYHHPFATGNTWSDNTCLAKEGAEIPACIPP